MQGVSILATLGCLAAAANVAMAAHNGNATAVCGWVVALILMLERAKNGS